MTPKERAAAIKYMPGQQTLPELRAMIEQAIIAAIEAEREECAKICDLHERGHRLAPEDSPIQYCASEASTLALAIRNRNT